VAIFVYVQPLIGTMLSVVILHEQLTLLVILSAILIFLGVALVSSHKLFPAGKKILPCPDER